MHVHYTREKEIDLTFIIQNRCNIYIIFTPRINAGPSYIIFVAKYVRATFKTERSDPRAYTFFFKLTHF